MFDHEDHEERRRVDEKVQIDALAVEPDQVSEEEQEQRDGGGNEDRPRARDRGVDGFCDLTRNLFHRLARLLQDSRLWGKRMSEDRSHDAETDAERERLRSLISRLSDKDL